MNDVIKFRVIDTETKEEARPRFIEENEDWASELVYVDPGQFYMSEDGILWLIDGLGNMALCPENRFAVLKR